MQARLKIDFASVNFFVIIPSRPDTEKKRVYVGAEERYLPQVRTEMLELIVLPFPFLSEGKIWPFHVVVVQRSQRNVQKSVMQMQKCYFAY